MHAQKHNGVQSSSETFNREGSADQSSSTPAADGTTVSSSAFAVKPSWAQIASSGLPAKPLVPVDAVMENGVSNTKEDGDDLTRAGAKDPAKDAVSEAYSLEAQLKRVFHVKLRTDLPTRPPRGLVNSGNSCFINVVLQALLASIPFRALLLTLESVDLPPSMPLLERFVHLAKEMFNEDAENSSVLEPLRPDFALKKLSLSNGGELFKLASDEQNTQFSCC